MEHSIQQGKWCHFQILTQDGSLSKKVCEVTSALLSLADKLYDPQSMDQFRKVFPSGTSAGWRMGMMVGGEFHKTLYQLAADARERGVLEARLKITRPTNQQINERYCRKGERSGAGPDFVLSGIFDGEDIHAAWDLTTIESIPSHYDRDILGIRRRRRGAAFEQQQFDPEIQQDRDTEIFWTSYVALYY